MNTTRSDKQVRDFFRNGNKQVRKTVNFEKTFKFPAEKVFPQLCPTREFDWIDGWDCELIYTTTGYAEDFCIFKSPDTASYGPGLWIITRYEPCQKFELVRIVADLIVVHYRVSLTNNHDGTSTGSWNITFTALNESGNSVVESITDSPIFERSMKSNEELEYFLETGEMMTI